MGSPSRLSLGGGGEQKDGEKRALGATLKAESISSRTLWS